MKPYLIKFFGSFSFLYFFICLFFFFVFLGLFPVWGGGVGGFWPRGRRILAERTFFRDFCGLCPSSLFRLIWSWNWGRLASFPGLFLAVFCGFNSDVKFLILLLRSTWGWLEVDLQVYFVGTRPARFSKNVIYDIGTKIIFLKNVFFFLTGISCFWKRFLQPFLDLKNSKDCTHVCNLLNLSDRQKVIN